MGGGYVVAAKPSARRASGAVGAWVAASGCRRRFDSKASAREFAREESPEGRTLWPTHPTRRTRTAISWPVGAAAGTTRPNCRASRSASRRGGDGGPEGANRGWRRTGGLLSEPPQAGV